MKTRIIGAALVVIFGMLATAGWLLRARADKAVEKLSEAIEPLAPAASQPADKIVLVRFGDADRITQADFERAAAGSDPKKYDRILGDMIVDRIYLLYLRDHPDLVPRAVIEAEIDRQVKISKLKTRDELKRRIEAKGNTWEQVEYQIKIRKAIPALKERGQKLAQDPKYLRQVFDKDRPAFDGTEVSARHIQINVRPSDLPAQVEFKRQRLAKIRDELVSGKRTWDNAVLESDDNSKFFGGDLGIFSRHMRMDEAIAEAAFKLKPGEFSDIVQSRLGLHLFQLKEYRPGNRSFDHPDTQKDLRFWMEQEPLYAAMAEAKAKYPIVVLRPPGRVSSAPAASTHPSDR